MKVVKRKISELIPAEYNPRKLSPKQENDLKNSLLEFGLVDPIIVNVNADRKNVIIGGHQRLKVWQKLGNKEIDCVEVDLSLEKERELNVRLNKNTGEFDFDILLSEFEFDDLVDWGFEIDELDIFEDKKEAKEDDFDVDEALAEEPETVLGDLYEIGEHRLLCGDSTDSDQVARLMNGEKADMVFTDPPYEIDLDYKNIVLFSENCHVFIFNNDRALIRQLKDSPLKFKKFFVFYHPGTAIPQEGGNEVFLDHVLVSHEINGKPKIRYNKGDGTRSVIKGEYRRAEEHKHEKPISFLSPIIEGYSNKKFIILDLFAGGGSMFSTSHQLNRKCYGMELDPKYCDVIVKRMIALDENLAIKRNGIDETSKWLEKIK